MRQRIKLVLLMHSMLNERWIDIFCLDELNKIFDLEFWDCTAIVSSPLKFTNQINRPYLRIVTSLHEFEQNLKMLPNDTLISTLVMFLPDNYRFHKVLSTYFPAISIVNFYSNDGANTTYSFDQIKEKKSKINFIKRVKRFLYKSDEIRYLTKIIFHHTKAQRVDERIAYYWSKEVKMYEQIIMLESNLNAPYRINHPDVEKYLSIKDEKLYYERYIVFLDEYYPNHPDTFVKMEGIDVSSIRKQYYLSLNRFFDQVEKENNCKIIIAAHPHSNYADNPFGGRKIIKYKTAELVRDSIAVCMHAGCTLSYVMLFDKPVLSIYNNATRQLISFQQYIEQQAEAWKMTLVDIDKVYANFHFERVNSYIRKNYIDFNLYNAEEKLRPNKELLAEHFQTIYMKLHDPKIIG